MKLFYVIAIVAFLAFSTGYLVNEFTTGGNVYVNGKLVKHYR